MTCGPEAMQLAKLQQSETRVHIDKGLVKPGSACTPHHRLQIELSHPGAKYHVTLGICLRPLQVECSRTPSLGSATALANVDQNQTEPR